MRDDIEDRLRYYASFASPPHWAELFAEAADAIHELRHELRIAQGCFKTGEMNESTLQGLP